MKSLSLPILVLSTCIFSTTANSQTSNFYLGGLIGQANYDLPTHEFLADGEDDSDTSFKAIVGYKYNQYLGLEGGYLSLGELKFSELYSLAIPSYPGVPIETFDNQISGSLEVDGYILNAVVSYPVLDKFSLYAKAGVFMWDTDFNSTLNQISNNPEIPSQSYSLSDSNDGSDLFYGAGVSYEWNRISLRVEYELFDVDGDEVDSLSIGATYNF
ncbi:outer membrane beta-barrel protein [Thalassotalea ponticola]|uniref:outer membrane beta-barrel protein n=1 Tax=Thalassotalea ponticola TaxID=1523392 RepID=UPI0025B2B1B6|nr:outer membrane beta-barrel protein [Thalassotalea ponticola]MDN3653788.1 outer membrane beta-barrel protein [Thalassotalea ponticola]